MATAKTILIILNKVKVFSTTISLTLLVLTSVLKLTRLSVILSSIWFLVKPLFISGLYLFILSDLSPMSPAISLLSQAMHAGRKGSRRRR